MQPTNQTENVYITELKSLLKDKFFMLLLGISVAIVLISTFYSFIRPKTNTGDVASGEQTNTVEASPTVVAELPEATPIPTVAYTDTSDIAGLDVVAGEESSEKMEEPKEKGSLFDSIRDKAKSLFGMGTSESEEEGSETVDGEPTGEMVNTTPKSGQEYIVQEGDNLWMIAETAYSSGFNFMDIASANQVVNPDYIEVGQRLKIPTVQPKEATVGDVTPQAAMTKSEASVAPNHTVVEGESLWLVAMNEYNDPYMWSRIAELNPTIINPDFIMPGQVLKLK